MHHGTHSLNSVATLDFPTSWSGWSSPAPARPKPARRSVWTESLAWLARGVAFASVVWLTVVLLVL